MASAENTMRIEWDGYSEALISGIWTFFENNLLVDTNVKCHQQGLKVHRLILAIFCPGLKDLFESEIAITELYLDNLTKDGQGDVLKYLVEFAYSGKVTIPLERLNDVFHAAELMGLEVLASIIRAVHGTNDEKTDYSAIADDKMTAEESPDNHTNESLTRTLAVCKNAKKKGVSKKSYKNLIISDRSDSGKVSEESGDRLRKRRRVRSVSASTDIESSRDADHGGDEGGCGDEDYCSSSGGEEDGKEEGRRTTKRVKRPERAMRNPGGNNPPANGAKPRRRTLYPCHYCDYTTREKITLRNHIAKRHNDTPTVHHFVCDICSKGFSSNSGYRTHMIAHNPDQKYKCDYCDYSTVQKAALHQHLTGIHRVDESGNSVADSIRCPQCDFTCSGSHQLKWHLLRKHTIDKPFKCKQCSFASVTRSELTKHVSVLHRKERHYMCDMCGFRSQTHGGLSRHKRGHLGIKPFKCELCGMKYADKSNYNEHLHRHTSDEKPFMCHMCGRAYRRRDNLKVHLRKVHDTNSESAKDAAVTECVVSEHPTPTMDSELYIQILQPF